MLLTTKDIDRIYFKKKKKENNDIGQRMSKINDSQKRQQTPYVTKKEYQIDE